MGKILYFAIGFVLGFFFLIIVKSVKTHIYRRNKQLKKKAFIEEMKKLHN